MPRAAAPPVTRHPLDRVEVAAVLDALDPLDLRAPTVRRVDAEGFATEQVLGRLAARIERSASPIPGYPPSIVHLGCGSAGVGLWLAEASRGPITLVDPDQRRIDRATHACGAFELAEFPSFRCAPFEDTGIPTGSANVVTSIESLYLAARPHDALAELHRILDDKGLLLFDAFVANQDNTALGWVCALQRTGFDVLDIDDQTPHWRTITRQQHLARLEYAGYLVDWLGVDRANREITASRAMLSILDSTRRIELVARRRRVARASTKLIDRTRPG